MRDSVFSKLTYGIEFTYNLRDDVEAFLIKHGEQETFEHIMNVVQEALAIAPLFNVSPNAARQAALLHDISNAISVSEMKEAAEEWSLPIMEEEHRYIRIIHQKLSMEMAHRIFGCTSPDILNAIECHTTLKAGASQLDKVLFVADKISWQLEGDHAYQADMRNKLDDLDLDGAALVYLDHVWNQRDKMKLVHPWLIAARSELNAQRV
ncbi:bis(5'-nucleosyl)-tetraphosphatase (symmetrical) YqeK [Paenibacillus lautus]|uniref:bis(5'-nucleosyl)-tetraphosphatase (symmetrical) YqeK n=1 Tax=Paenibacillus lautus TaxID=1401 RepID=UPI002DBFDDEF|nr:bis(5'-nucleosyl)-tetraphosphatase (symmetrical) YqeK [Paenibacillus lautus]MEC0257356.1 bis(5'-nucleosyl)-tetraphosphatase (symmetrical) YqeK [Paenibacillus lautus]